MNIVKDGRTIDTLENFRWPFLVGGPADGQRVPTARSWKQTEIEVDGETYLRHRYLSAGAPARIGYFVAKDLPGNVFEPYALHRRILNSHPELERLDDIIIDTGSGTQKQDVERQAKRDAEKDEYERNERW